MHRAEMIAGQALRTPLAPNRLPVHTDIVHRTDLFTDTTADAGIRSMKPTGRHQETAEQGTNYIGFQERHASLMTVKTTLPAGDLDLNSLTRPQASSRLRDSTSGASTSNPGKQTYVFGINTE